MHSSPMCPAHKQIMLHAIDWLIDWVVVLRPTRHKTGHFVDILASQSLGLVLINWKKHKKQTCIHNKAYQNIKLTQRTKARFSHLLRHSAWKRRGPILVLAIHKFVTYLLTWDIYPLTYSPGTHTGLLHVIFVAIGRIYAHLAVKIRCMRVHTKLSLYQLFRGCGLTV